MSIEMDLDGGDTSELSSVESEQPEQPAARRTSGRIKKAGRPAYTSTAAAKGKQTRRKASAQKAADIAVPSLDENGELVQQSEDDEVAFEDDQNEEDESEADEDDGDDADFQGAKSRSTAGGRRRGGGSKRGRPGGGRTGSRGGSTAQRGRPRKNGVNGEAGEGHDAIQADATNEDARARDDFSVEADNNLFNAVKDPRAAVAATVEDWLENYRSDEDTRGQALADLVNFVLRCCGCNLSVDLHEAQDIDGVVSKLDDIQTDFARVNQASYPLISKSKGYKKFRASLQDFLGKLVETTANSEVLYDDIFCETLQSWLVALSSSKLRAFRHTSTVIALLFVEALCQTSVSNKEDLALLQRQKEAEIKRTSKPPGKTTRAGATDKTRLQELEALVKRTHNNKMKLETYFREIFDAVFIHRYRDAEPSIRVECIKSLGVWMSTLPEQFLEGTYLRYIGWMLTDLDKNVRREAVSALSALYDMDNYIGSMQHFTERFKSRLVEMALSDAESSIRVEAIQRLRQIDKHALLDDEQRDEIAGLIFDAEARIRRAAAVFFDNMLKESVDDKRGDYEGSRRQENEDQHSNEERENTLQWKCLAEMLVNLNTQLDAKIASQLQELAVPEVDDAGDDMEDTGTAESAFTRYNSNRDRTDAKLRKGKGPVSASQITAILQGQNKDRMSLAVETLHFEIEIIRNWQSLLDYLLLDHSAAQNGVTQNQASASTSAAPSVDAPATTSRQQVDATCRLTDAEESILLSVFVSSVKTTRDRAKLLASISEDEREEVLKSTTRAIINGLPRLFAKHQTDRVKCTTLLSLPEQMDLDLYLDMRQVTAYEQLWDDVARQFTQHGDIYLLEKAMDAMSAMRHTQALSASNAEKCSSLEATVVEALRGLFDDIDANNATPLDEDALQKFDAWLARLCLILKHWDMTAALTESTSGSQATLLEAIKQLVERGQMGFHEEEKVIQQALDIQYLCYLWRITKISQNESTPEALIEERDAVVQQCKDYAIGELNAVSEGVKRTAFRLLLDLHIAAKARYSITEDPIDLLKISLETQYRCAGFVQAEIERYASLFARGESGDDLIDENEDQEDNEENLEEGAPSFQPVTLAQHAATYAFNDLIVSFARAVCVDVLDLHHASTMLIHYDRFGPFYNECCRWLGDAIRQFGIIGDAGHAAAGVAVESFKGAVELYVSTAVKSESSFMSLARHLSNHLVLRGRGFAIAARLPSENLVRLHKDLITYTVQKYKRLAGQEKHASKNKVLIMFKGLLHCLIAMTGKEAAIVHTHMNEVLKEAEIEVPAASKHWDGQRAYDKRLVTLMSKDAGIKITARKTVKKRTQATNGGTSDVEGEDENDGSQLPGRGRPKAKPLAKASDAKKTKIVKQQKAPRPQTLPTRRSNRATVQEGTSRYAEDSSDIDVEERSEAEKRREGAGGKRAASPSASEENEEGEASENAPQENGTSLPKRKGAVKPSPKRPRETESEEEEENDEELPPPLVSQQKARKPGTTSATNGEPGPSSQPVMSLSTQDLAETEPFSLDLPDTPPGLDSQSDAGSDAPRRKRSRY